MNVRKPLDAIHFALAHMAHELAGKVPGWSDRLAWSMDVDIHCHEQVWGDSKCGFSGIACQAVTTADTVVLVVRDAGWRRGPVAVYHATRFAYRVDRPSELFWDDFDKCRLRGAANYDEEYEQR